MTYIIIGIITMGYIIIFHNPIDIVNRKKEKTRLDSLIEFLEKADNAYINAHNLKDVTGFSRYATDGVLIELLDNITYGETLLFGTEKYRIREWEILERTEYSFLIKKNISHKHVRLNKGVNVAIGDSLTELWRVKKSPTGYVVVDIH